MRQVGYLPELYEDARSEKYKIPEYVLREAEAERFLYHNLSDINAIKLDVVKTNLFTDK